MSGSMELVRLAQLAPSAIVFRLDLGYRVGELVQIGAERAKKALDREPLDASSSSLDARYIGRVHLEARCKLLLRYLGLIPQRSERAAEDDQIDVSCVLGQGRAVWYSGSGYAMLQRSNIVPPRRWNGRGRGAEDQGFSAWATIAVRGWWLLRRGGSSVPPTKEEPKMAPTLTVPATVIAEVREALLGVLNDAVEAMTETLAQAEHELHPEWFEDDRRRFEGVCRLLDAIGWDAGSAATEIEVPCDDAPMIREAVEGYLATVEGWVPETGELRRRREHRSSVQAMLALLESLRDIAPAREPEA